MDEDILKKTVATLGVRTIKGENWRQIKLLEKILITTGLDERQARKITAPLGGLNDLRVGAAHLGSVDLKTAFNLLGSDDIPKTPRAGWNVCVDAVAASLNSIAEILEK